VFLINSRPALFSATPEMLRRLAASPPRVPHIPKLRGPFVEFLSGGSPERLGTFIPAHRWRFAVRTPQSHNREAFLVGMGSADFPNPKVQFASTLSSSARVDLPAPASPSEEDANPITRSAYPPAPLLGFKTRQWWRRNINLLSIAFGFRLRLRPG